MSGTERIQKRMSKTWRYSMSKHGWDWRDRYTGESGFIPGELPRSRTDIWNEINIAANNIPESLSEKEEVVDVPRAEEEEDTLWLEDKSLDRFNDFK